MKKRFEALNTDKVINEVVQDSTGELADLNRDQMYDGKTKDGNNITPSYLDDPYFKSRESAKRYSDWKDKITPSSKRSPGTPNLFINGRYHNSIRVVASSDKVTFQTQDPAARSIEAKFDKIYGLGGEYKKNFLKDTLQPKIKEKITKATGLKFKK